MAEPCWCPFENCPTCPHQGGVQPEPIEGQTDIFEHLEGSRE